MNELSGYEVSFRQDGLFGWWSYTVKTPRGEILVPLLGAFMDKRNAEKSALRRIKAHRAAEKISGEELARRVQP